MLTFGEKSSNEGPMIDYIDNTSKLDQYDVSGFFVDWPNPPSEARHKQLLENCQYIWLAVEENKVVGFINAVSNKTLSAYVPLLEVLPEYQGKGIGKRLVELMLGSLKHLYMIDIMCDDNLVPFYKQFDLIQSTGMVLRHYANQSGVSEGLREE